MSWFQAAIYDRFMRESERACLAAWRAELCAGLAGEVLEVGAGTGANLTFYPPAVRRIVLAEPDRHMGARLRRRVVALADPRCEIIDAPVEQLPCADESFDAVVSTMVLCSVGSPERALAEIRRVLRPGGRLAFIEHVAAEEPGRLGWQRRVEPLWRRIAGNCHLTRRTAEAIAAAGFEEEQVRRESIRKALPITRPSVRGISRKPMRGSGVVGAGD